MSDKSKKKRDLRKRRHARVRRNVVGTAARPRLAVFRSNKYISAQLIDDGEGNTLAAASSLEADLRTAGPGKETAAKVGTLVAQRAKDAGIETVVFDRGGNRYHGRIAALADAAREAGLEF
jgi:large subunit ribosomal protein L18